MTLVVALAAALARERETVAKLGDQRRHLRVVGLVVRTVGADAGVDDLHERLSPSTVLKPHSGQRQTACIRYISALPHRSQIIRSSASHRRLWGDDSSVFATGAAFWPVVLSGSAMRGIIGQRFSGSSTVLKNYML